MAVKGHDNYFVQKPNGLDRLRLSSLQKVMAAFRRWAYEVVANATNEYIKIEESITIENLKRFCHAIIEILADQYLKSPTANDVERLLYIGKQSGFPGLLDSLDYMHRRWKNCPMAWAGQFTSRSGSPTIILEAGIAPSAQHLIQEKQYNMEYYLVDDISLSIDRKNHRKFAGSAQNNTEKPTQHSMLSSKPIILVEREVENIASGKLIGERNVLEPLAIGVNQDNSTHTMSPIKRSWFL
ncbi:uncharacterized protein LOC111411299 [Olea europaea var. sylvestris]|uniref:uncharacterized protein LOC111411299 n=1 Tax=Olea europaea var. sylvestris TaxID=158386 RepID=UPI000C1CDAF8|nr:uncharacterized protein LOC111411299 [Olea europaea var. sylvestris]